MKRKKLLLAALALTLAFAGTACGSSSSSTVSEQTSPSPEASVEPSADPSVEITDDPAEDTTNDTTDDTTADDVADLPAQDPTEELPGADDEFPVEENDGIVEDENSPAKLIQAHFESLMAKDKEYTTEKLAEKLINNTEVIPFAGASAPVEPGFLNGFREEITGFKSAASFGPVIGSIPFIGYIFELEDGADTEAFMAELESKSNLRWNVCTEAEERLCSHVDNYVFFIMAPAMFED